MPVDGTSLNEASALDKTYAFKQTDMALRTVYLALLFMAVHAGMSPRVAAQSGGETDRYFEISKNLEIFSNLFKELDQLYVEPLQPGRMVKIAVDAMLADLDPYTNYISEAEIEDIRFQTTGRYGGIGATTLVVDSQIVIAQPYEGGPVDKAGIKAGDIILAIDGKSIKGLEPDDLGLLMRGSPGTSLTMQIQHPISGAESTKTITREEIKISSVPYAGLTGPDKDIAYVNLSQFMQHAARDIRNALDSLRQVSPALKGVILDLRDNPGGLLDEAVKVCNLFIEGGQKVVTTKGKGPEWTKVFTTRENAWDAKIPLAVLINHRSASASEIVAGTVQDLDRGIVLGSRSFGKGLVQEIRPLGYNTRLKVTVAKYYTPSGRCIQALDYAHKNEDGSVSAIPDSLKKYFTTRSGRPVMDGGGIDPDRTVGEEENSKMAFALMGKNLIFKYATQYYYAHPSITSPQQFEIDESGFQAFSKWLQDKDFSYRTDGEKLLNALKEKAEEEKYFSTIRKEYDALKTRLSEDKSQELESRKSEIMDLLGSEIVSRYYYQNGRVLYQLAREDNTIAEAQQLLGDQKAYAALLSPGQAKP